MDVLLQSDEQDVWEDVGRSLDIGLIRSEKILKDLGNLDYRLAMSLDHIF